MEVSHTTISRKYDTVTYFNQIPNIKMQFVIFQFFGTTYLMECWFIKKRIMLEKKSWWISQIYAHFSTKKFPCTLKKNWRIWYKLKHVVTISHSWSPIIHWFMLFDIPRGIRIRICVSWTISWDRISFNILGRSSSM